MFEVHILSAVILLVILTVIIGIYSIITARREEHLRCEYPETHFSREIHRCKLEYAEYDRRSRARCGIVES